MRLIVEQALRTAYTGPDTVEVIAKRHNVSASSVRRFWQAEKSAGRITDRPRPYFARYVAVPVTLGIDPIDIEFADLDDANVQTPTADNDPLLFGLRAVHERDRTRGVNDEMPVHLLSVEAADRHRRYTPSPSRLRDFQRGRDAYVAARMTEKPAPSNSVYARVGRAWWALAAKSMVAGPFLAFEAAQEWGRMRGMVHAAAQRLAAGNNQHRGASC